MLRSFDIFCQVIDHYGDIGVCWRLARRLAAMPQHGRIRLWVDDLASFARIAPHVDPHAATQSLRGIDICRWRDAAVATPADIVIEAFACTLPAAYVVRMSERQVWINLEYLSAEAWVESCHCLPSLQGNGLRKFFFFPGFTAGTGGLLREPELITKRDAWQADPHARLSLLRNLGVESDWLHRVHAGARLVYVYCYPDSPLPALLAALEASGRDTLVLLPEGIAPHSPPPGVQANSCRVEMRTHAFVEQDIFDQLLWSADLNIVRGEDSLVRAVWAARPLIWQPYRQAGDAHLQKLAAWLALTPFQQDTKDTMEAWNRGHSDAFKRLLTAQLKLEALENWKRRTQHWSTLLAKRDDLATQLADFCAKMSQTS